MAARAQHFEITRKLDRAKIGSQLGSRYALGNDKPDAVDRTYYDTFDWRLFRQKSALVTEPSGDKFDCGLLDLQSGEVTVGAQVEVVPRFPLELPVSCTSVECKSREVILIVLN